MSEIDLSEYLVAVGDDNAAAHFENRPVPRFRQEGN
jgi:hypothetical protein